ncbi:MAG: MFS transporter [Chloroflexota bacterium]|nr:MFS transporter [Chloroflexota bacterium]
MDKSNKLTTSSLPDSTALTKQSQSSWSVLRNRNYALLFWGQLISSTGTQLWGIVVIWQVYLLTHSALALGLIGLVQAIPRLVFSLVGGLFADVFDRRKMLLIIDGILASLSTLLALFTFFHVINVFIIYGIVLIATSVAAFEYPTRQAIIPSLVPREQMADATSLSMVMAQLTGIVGPMIGGFLIAWVGIATTYWLDVLSYGIVISSLLFMVVPRIPAETRPQVGVSALMDGLRFLRTHPIILSVISLDFFAVFFGSPIALLPVFANDILHVGSQGLGILLAADSIGAIAVAPFAGRVGHIARKGLGVVLSILVWGICIIAFGLFPSSLWLAALFLLGAGAADMVSMLLRFMIIPLITPDEFRGRIGSVNAMFAIGGTQLGSFESGFVAALTTPQISVVSGGIICILATIVIVACVPNLLKVKVK